MSYIPRRKFKRRRNFQIPTASSIGQTGTSGMVQKRYQGFNRVSAYFYLGSAWARALRVVSTSITFSATKGRSNAAAMVG